MLKNLIALAATAAVALAVSACSDSHSSTANLAPGKYERTTTSTNANGTTVKHKTYPNVTEDDEGNRRAVVDTRTSRDPRGLFNKTTTESRTVTEENPY